MKRISWPEGKRFAFTIVDDTDNATVSNVKPVYDLLYKHGILGTKTVWVYPSRDTYTGECLQDANYLEFIRDLQSKGYEIGLHNVGSGDFSTTEIAQGFEIFREKLGTYPQMHINHAENPDSIYWGKARFCFPVNRFNTHTNKTGVPFSGELADSPYFWGETCKKHIKYIRNKVFQDINTLKCDPRMPYREKKKDKYSNFWFSSSDGANVDMFKRLFSDDNLDRLEKQGGCCILYTHFTNGFLLDNGSLDSGFVACVESIAARNGWFVPAGRLLDFLLENKQQSGFASPFALAVQDYKWLFNRVLRKY